MRPVAVRRPRAAVRGRVRRDVAWQGVGRAGAERLAARMLGAVHGGPCHMRAGADQRVLVSWKMSMENVHENVPHQPENFPRLESLSRLRFGADEILVSSIGP